MKFRNRALIKILTALILIAITLSIPLTANALSQASMTSSDPQGAGTLKGGPTKDRTGWLFYCIDPVTNTQVTDTYCVTNNWNLKDRSGNFIPNQFMISRYGVEMNWDTIEYTTPWGFGAWKSVGNNKYKGTGTDLKNWLQALYTSNSDGKEHERAWGFVHDNFGSDMAEKFSRQEVYLVFEPIFGNAIFNNGKNTGYWAIGTSFWWGQVNIAFGVPDTGDSYVNTFTNDMFGHCIMLEDNEVTAATRFNPATKTSGFLTNAEMGLDQWNGYGIGIIRSSETSDTQTTNDETKSSPHNPADESTGTYQIVKSYVDKLENVDGSVTYTDAGTYVKTDSASEISIEDETSNTGIFDKSI